ncbi:hypothetical protein BDA99DRAFT_1766 [Phascolomyces articulosus]|uniref:Uncharacterized protein n=1 Tax=Phascolomyces articulosus TaxID=60185 RepID=A0AAD5KC55_9FUNG|nr:hypothetical protein BDA99DRAFT_1766 [Phascolomyces articulosus]
MDCLLAISRLTPILQRYPNLTLLIISMEHLDGIVSHFDTNKWFPNEENNALDWDQLFFVWCPKLQYLQVNSIRSALYETLDIYTFTNIKKDTITRSSSLPRDSRSTAAESNSLQGFVTKITGAMETQEIVPIILRNVSSVTHLVLEDIHKDKISTIPGNKNWTWTFRSFYEPQLRSLILNYILYDQIETLLNVLHPCQSLEMLIVRNRKALDNQMHHD